MRTIPYLKIHNKKQLTELTSSSMPPYKNILTRLSPCLRAAYFKYWRNRLNLSSITAISLSPNDKETLKHIYKIKKSKLREKICREDLQSLTDCPYCGINESHTLDHYLPQDNFPEYSVFLLNLIPCCGRCNSLKSLTMDVVNCYWDDLSKYSFFDCAIFLQNNLAACKFTMLSPPLVSVHIMNRVTRHVHTLELLKRYRNKSMNQLSLILKGFKRDRTPVLTAQVELLRMAQLHEESKGINNWEPVLYRGLARDITQKIIDSARD